MAFSFFGKKDKNPPEAPAPVAKAPPTPPKIQPPPNAPSIPAVKPPQPSGLIPTSGMTSGAATTQPMVMPRTAPGSGGLKPARPGVVQSTRSTQRIVLPGGVVPGKPSSNTKSLAGIATPPVGRINLPAGMILRCMPAEVLAGDIADFDASGAAATEIGLPTNLILPQLPSGKVEIALADLVPHFPAGYLQPTASITNYLPTMINLPLMDVVMRIPPDLLALRPDQKGVDAAVINMADPFTEEILREQAEAARRQAQAQNAAPNVIDESQVPPAEEFVPRQQAPVPKTVAPPPRPTTSGILPPVVPGAQSAMPAAPARLPGAVAPVAPTVSARTISASGRLPGAPTRATAAIPARSQQILPQAPQLPPQAPVPPASPTAPIPPAPVVHAAPMPTAPVPPVPRQTTSLPMPTLPPQPPVATSLTAPTTPLPAPPEIPEPEPVSEPVTPGVPDAAADDLQRLAALAMAQLGDAEESAAPEVEQPAAPVEIPPDQAVTVPLATLPEAEAVAPEPVVEPAIPSPTATSSLPMPAITPQSVAAVPAAKPPTAPLPPVATPLPVAPAPISAPPAPTASQVLPPPANAVSVPLTASQALPTPPAPAPQPEAAAPSGEATAFNLNTCTVEDLLQIPGCFRELAESIVRHRTSKGSFKSLEDLLDVPGMTKAAYTSLTGENPPDNRIPLTLNELLGFPADQHISLKDVTDRICCWPDVTGCVLSQGSGLSLVGHTPANIDKAALVAFVPRMFESLNKSFAEIVGKQTDDIVIPTPGTSFHILRARDLFLIILCRLPQMPERHLRVARYVLTALSIRTD